MAVLSSRLLLWGARLDFVDISFQSIGNFGLLLMRLVGVSGPMVVTRLSAIGIVLVATRRPLLLSVVLLFVCEVAGSCWLGTTLYLVRCQSLQVCNA